LPVLQSVVALVSIAKDILGEMPSQAKHAATLAPHRVGAVQVSGSVDQNERKE